MAESAAESAIARCQTSCDDDCEAPCHESHEVLNRRHHDVAGCEAGQKRWAEMVAELEQLRESRRMSLEINQGWVAYRERTKARRREFLDKIAQLTRERDAMEARFARLADELEQRGHERDEIGDDDPSEDDTCAEEGLDCHTVSAVATWFRAARLVRAALTTDPA